MKSQAGLFAFHIVDVSPWPIMMSGAVFTGMVQLIEFFLGGEISYLKIFFVTGFCILAFFGWMADIIREGTFLGMHTSQVQKGLSMGFILFVLSEVMFFLSFFWSLFYFSLTPSIELGGWPPAGIVSLDPQGVPLLGTIILMSSGISVTWMHHSILEGEKAPAIDSLLLTIALGLCFTILQLLEYCAAPFCMSDSVYGSIFFLATGFHGLHVIVGTVFLAICLSRILGNHFSAKHHAGLEFAIWYWHFVDVVWLLLYVCVYWWGW